MSLTERPLITTAVAAMLVQVAVAAAAAATISAN